MMDKIGFVIVKKTDHPDQIFSNKEFSVGEKCSKIVAFSQDHSKAILQVWIDETAEYDVDIEVTPKVIPGQFKKAEDRKNHIEGKEVDLWDSIPKRVRKYKMKARKKKRIQNISGSKKSMPKKKALSKKK